MRVRPAQIVTVVLLLVLVGSTLQASARGENGTQPTPDKNVLYAHTMYVPASSTWIYWTNNAVHDPGHNQDASAAYLDSILASRQAGDNCNQIPDDAPPEASTYCTYKPWTFNMKPTLNNTVILDESGSVDFTVYVTSKRPTGAGVGDTGVSAAFGSGGPATISAELTFGNDTVARGEPKQVDVPRCIGVEDQTATCDWAEVTWSVAPNVTELSGQGNLQWNVSLHAPTLANWIMVGADKGEHHSNVALPILSSTAPLAVSTSKATASGAQGGTASYDLTVTNNGDSDVRYELSTAGLPDDYVAGFEPASTTLGSGASADSSLTLSVPDDAEPGTVEFEVEVAEDGNVTDSVQLSLEVLKGAGLSLSASPSAIDVEPGSSATVDLTLENTGGTAADFSTRVDGLAGEWDAAVEPSEGTVDADASTSLTLDVEAPSDADSGTTVDVVVEGDDASATATVDVDIQDDSTSTPDVADPGASIPGPSAALVAGLLGACALLVARRD